MNKKQKSNINNLLESAIRFDVPLSDHTTFGIGGPASCFVFPNNRTELSKLLKFAKNETIPILFIGSGSNILVWDEGFNGFAISLRKTFKKLSIKILFTTIIIDDR